MTANIRHSSAACQWGTAREFVAIAQATLHPFREPGESAIDVDPFSEPEFNELVGAARILTGEKGRDGFVDRWVNLPEWPRTDHVLAGMHNSSAPELIRGEFTALVNPPGDERGENVKRAWVVTQYLWLMRWLDSALWVGFSCNQLQTLQRAAGTHPLSDDFAGFRCVPDHRLEFVAHSSRPPTRVSKHGEVVDNDDAPSHPAFCVLLPSHDEEVRAEQLRLFDSMGSALGAVF